MLQAACVPLHGPSASHPQPHAVQSPLAPNAEQAAGESTHRPSPPQPGSSQLQPQALHAPSDRIELQAVVLVQKDAFGDIAIKRHSRFGEVFSSGEAMSAIEKDYS